MADALNDTVRDTEKLEHLLNVPMIGAVPSIRSAWRFPFKTRAPQGQLVDGNHRDKRVTSYREAIRTLRNRILLTQREYPLKSILITSAGPREGKTSTALHVALAYAEQGHKTLLCDCDLRRPRLNFYFDLPNTQGLSTVLTENQPWRAAVTEISGVPNLSVLCAGPSSRRAADLVGKEVNRIVQEASTEYELVIVDGPPMLGFAESLQIATAVAGVLIIARSGATKTRAIAAVANILNQLGANISGIIINEVKWDHAESYYYLDRLRYRDDGAAIPVQKIS
jgi:capsular exopolysaccharide synthesis family protein